MTDAAPISAIVDLLSKLMSREPVETHPVLAALSGRFAAKRYRAWAVHVSSSRQRDALLECASREDELANRVEALYPDATIVQQKFAAANPDFEQLYDSFFTDASLPAQFSLQAQAERVGVIGWRLFASRETDSRRVEAFTYCAELEEQTAAQVEELVRMASSAP